MERESRRTRWALQRRTTTTDNASGSQARSAPCLWRNAKQQSTKEASSCDSMKKKVTVSGPEGPDSAELELRQHIQFGVSVVTLGCARVGKTALIQQFANGGLRRVGTTSSGSLPPTPISNASAGGGSSSNGYGGGLVFASSQQQQQQQSTQQQQTQPTQQQQQPQQKKSSVTSPLNRAQHFHFSTVVLNSKIFELRCIDLPPVVNFPRDSIDEFESCPGYGVRAAAAYLLVYDCADVAHTFGTIETLYKQIRRYRPNAPVVVVAAKYDLVGDSTALQGQVERAALLVSTKWDCPHVICSAHNNWRVNSVFQELVALIDRTENDTVREAQQQHSDELQQQQQLADRQKCRIM